MTFSSSRDWPDCACGCGEPVPARKASNKGKGWKVGDPCRYVAGHSNRPRIRRQVDGKFQCPKCSEYKAPTEFHKDSSRRHGIYVYCKACQSFQAHKRYEREKTEILARTKQYNRANPDVTAKANKHYRATQRGAENARQNASAYRARRANAFVEHIDPERVWVRSKGRCGICGGPISRDDFHVDHRIPLARGGNHSYDNVQAAHPRCNARKRDRLTSEVDLAREHSDMATGT